jgi:hypothetical protein
MNEREKIIYNGQIFDAVRCRMCGCLCAPPETLEAHERWHEQKRAELALSAMDMKVLGVTTYYESKKKAQVAA